MLIVRFYWSLLVLLLIGGSLAAAPAQAQNAYIANSTDNTVSGDRHGDRFGDRDDPRRKQPLRRRRGTGRQQGLCREYHR
ncbi:MAG: hypothetical protein WDN69_10360 [Aliidongia sp.]